MDTIVCMLKGVNLGPHRRIKMDALKAVFESLGMHDCRTLVQSGNLVFRTTAKDLQRLSKRIEQAFQEKFGFHSEAILRTASEMRQVVERSPFAGRTGLHPGKLNVTFLATEPGEEARANARQLRTEPEEVHIIGRELYIYFPNGMGRTKLPMNRIEKTLGTPGTTRNWNTITKLLEMAEARLTR